MCATSLVSANASASGVHDVAGAGEQRHAVEIGVPTEVIDVEVGEEDDVDLVEPHTRSLEHPGQQPLVLRRPVPQARRADSGVDEGRDSLRAYEVAEARQPPAVTREVLRIQSPVRLPRLMRHVRIRLGVLAQHADRVEHRLDLDRPDYHFTRGGAGSP